MLAAHGFPPHTPEEYRHFVGNGIQKLIERALGKAATPELTAELLAEFRVLYDRECLHYVSLYPSIADAVRTLRERGIRRLPVVTNKPEPQAQERRSSPVFSPPARFPAVYGNVDSRPRKPDRTVVEVWRLPRSAQRTKTPCLSAIPTWMCSLRTAPGLRCIGCTWGFRGEAELKAAGADRLADSADQLADTVLHLFGLPCGK